MSAVDTAFLALGECARSYDTPILESGRLTLRPLRLDDAAVIFERWASDPAVTRYMSWNTHRTVEDTMAWLELEQASLDAPDNFTFGYVLKEPGGLIGSGGILYSEESGAFELGYCLMASCWGQGYATEAARTIMQFAIDVLGITEFCSSHATENHASGNVLTKLGFAYCSDSIFVSPDGTKAFPRKNYRYTASPDGFASRPSGSGQRGGDIR